MPPIDVTIEVQGRTPLVMHNPQMADPMNPIVREIKDIQGKRSHMTDADRLEVARLQWLGSLYTDEDGNPVVQTRAVVRSFQEAAKMTRKGKDVIRALYPHELQVPLEWDRTGDVRKLWPEPTHVWTTMVGVKTSRVPSTRPIFRRWAFSMTATLVEEALDFRVLEDIAATAGQIEGLLDARVLGNGRYTVSIKKLPA